MRSCLGEKGPASAARALDACTGAIQAEAPLLEGTVAICGWFGCTEKNLEKYAAWWREQGWQPVLIRIERNLDVLSMRAGLRHGHSSYRRLAATQARTGLDLGHRVDWDVSSFVRQAAAGSLSRLSDASNGGIVYMSMAAVVQRGGCASVLFHAFSMVGWSLYSMLLQDMAAAQGLPGMANVCGAVLDSTPETAICCTRTMAAAAYTVLEGKSQSSKEMESTATFRVLKAFFAVWTRPGGPRWRAVKQTIEFVKQNEAFPQLYIYSTADVVIRSKSIEAHMQRQRQRGCAVRSLRLEDTPHCGHFRSHRAQYCAAIAAFLQHDVQAAPGLQAATSFADMSLAPAAYISLAEPIEAAGAGKAEAPITPRGACTDKAGAAAAVLQPPTPDIAMGGPRSHALTFGE